MLPFALLGAWLTWLVFEKILGVVVPQPFWLGPVLTLGRTVCFPISCTAS